MNNFEYIANKFQGDFTQDGDLLQLLYRIAYLYANGEKQYEIARELGLSKSKVNRLLKKMYEEGIIEIKINLPEAHLFHLEQELLENSHLREAIVVPYFTDNAEYLLSAVCKAAAEYVLRNLRDDMTLAIGGGRTLYGMISSLETRHIYEAKIVPALGGIQGRHDTAVNYLAGELARRTGSTVYQLLAQAFCSSAKERDEITNMPQVKPVLDMARNADMIVMTIGSIEPEVSSFHKFTKIPSSEIHRIIDEEDGVGEILSQVININGQPCAIEYAKRVVGLTLQEVKGIGSKVAIAALKHKVKPIIAALRGDFVDVLITEEETARQVIEGLHKKLI